jgi:hypothetical protein
MLAAPYPSVSIPQGWKEMEFNRLSTTISHSEFDHDVIRRLLGICSKDITVVAVLEDSSVNEFKFWFSDWSTSVLML